MTDKTLGWLSLGTLGLYFVFYFAGGTDANPALNSILACLWLGVSIWAAIRLINK